MKTTKGARPIKHNAIQQHYFNHVFQTCTLVEYTTVWQNWLQNSFNKTIQGLDQFMYSDFVAGTSNVFDHFVLKHSGTKEITVLPGEFQYHKCISRHQKFNISNSVHKNSALIISLPFSDYGKTHPNFYDLLDQCNALQVPVCLDVAYWGVAKDIELNLNKYPCIMEIAASLSKPFYTLETHRVGIRFSRDYQNDGISMLNEVGMQNLHSMSLGIHFMNKFSCDWNWQTHGNNYYQLCSELNLKPCDTVLFGIGGSYFDDFNRGISENNRVCISPGLGNL